MDSASDAPIVINDSMREILLELTRAKTMVQKAKIASQIHPAYLAPRRRVRASRAHRTEHG